MMKNSTLSRANISRENIAVLEKLYSEAEAKMPKYQKYPENPNKAEIDMLWQNLKVSHKEHKSPGLFIVTGFIVGLVGMFFLSTIFSLASSTEPHKTETAAKEHKIVKKQNAGFFKSFDFSKAAKKSVADEELLTATVTVNEKYSVRAGDSLEAISLKYYGRVSPENISKIQKANNLKSPHAIKIGQELVIPMD